MSIENAIFRVDKAADIGTGHVARSSVLAQYLSQEFQTKVTWIGTPETKRHMVDMGLGGSFNDFIEVPECRENFQHNAFDSLGLYLPDFGAERPLFVQDGMKMDHRTLKAAREKGIVGLSLIIEERLAPDVNLGDPSFLVDVLPHDENDYTAEMVSTDTAKLIGPEYQMISPKFKMQSKKRSEYRIRQQETGEKNVILMNGGMNVAALLNYLVWGLMKERHRYNDTHFHVYTLSKANYYSELSDTVDLAKQTGLKITLHTNKAPNYAEADLYVGAGGTSVFEMCAAGGLASVIIGAGNGQDDLGLALARRKAAHYAGTFWRQGQSVRDVEQASLRPVYEWIEGIVGNDDLRASMSGKSHSFCDGDGAKRITDHLFKASQVRLSVKNRLIETP